MRCGRSDGGDEHDRFEAVGEMGGLRNRWPLRGYVAGGHPVLTSWRAPVPPAGRASGGRHRDGPFPGIVNFLPFDY